MGFRRPSPLQATFAFLLLAGPLFGQLPGNSSLKGAYYFRYLGVDASGSTPRATSAYGTVTFDGNGAFQINGTQLTRNGTSNQTATLSSPDAYQVRSNAIFTMNSPFSANILFGGVGVGGVVVASSTDSNPIFCDLFVAIPLASSASAATLNGTYNVAGLEFLNGDFGLIRNTFFPLAANGSGGIGNLSIRGTALNLNNADTTQSVTGSTYSLNASGTGTLTIPAPSGGVAANNQLLTGAKTLYVSQDGNLFIAGGTSSYDFILGVKSFSGATPLKGLYFTGLLQDDTEQTDGFYASQGSANEVGAPDGLEIAHERANNPAYPGFDLTYSDYFKFDASGTVSFTRSRYAAGGGGNFAVTSGNGSTYQLGLYVKAPELSGTGVFLHPMGIVNAASNAPFTAAVSPGEFLSLYGTGMSTQTVTAAVLPFGTTLGGVEVTITGSGGYSAKMPLYYVSPTLISGVVPFTIPTDGSFLTFQVNSGNSSNSVQIYSGQTSPGVFTISRNGIGNGAILHQDGVTAVTSSSPAKPGEVIALFLSGLGAVNGQVTAGAAAPSDTLATIKDESLAVFIDGLAAPVSFQGLAPALAGLYQLNVTVPSRVSTGDVDLEIVTVDGDNFQATVPIGR